MSGTAISALAIAELNRRFYSLCAALGIRPPIGPEWEAREVEEVHQPHEPGGPDGGVDRASEDAGGAHHEPDP